MPHSWLASAALVISQEDPAQPDVVELLRHGEAFSAGLYPKESNHHLPLEALRRTEVRFFVARDGEGKALATGAIVLHDNWVEIKRMWVDEAARGRGIARQILNDLMAEAGGAASKCFAWKPGSLVMLHWPSTKRQASNAGSRLPTVAPTPLASSWNDRSNPSRRPSATVRMGHASPNQKLCARIGKISNPCYKLLSPDRARPTPAQDRLPLGTCDIQKQAGRDFFV